MNIKRSVDGRLARRARKKAQAMGRSLNQLVREYFERFVGSDDAGREVNELREISRASSAQARHWRFNRDELHERP